MKNIVFFLCFAVAMIAVQPARAYESPAQDPVSKKLIDAAVHTVEPYTDLFDIKKLVWANVADMGQIVILQFMPEDLEDPNAWTRMMEITVYGLSGDLKADLLAEKKLILGLETQYKRVGTLSADDNYLMNENHDMGMFVQYTVNSGKPEQMTAAGAFLRVTDKAAAYVQLDTRTRPLKKSEANKMHKLVNPTIDSATPIRMAPPKGK